MGERQVTESSWIPKTPGKSAQAEQQSICKDQQSVPCWLNAGGNSQTPQAADIGNCSHLGNSVCFQREIQSKNVQDLSNQKDSVHVSFDNHGVGAAGNSSGIGNASSFYLDLWNQTLMDRTDDAIAATAAHVKKGSCTPASTYHVQRASSRAESSDSSSTFKGRFHESVTQSAFVTNQLKGAELNAGTFYQTAPLTPNLTNTVNKANGSDKQNYWVGEAAKGNEDNTPNKIPFVLSELLKEGQSELSVDISCSNVSKTSLENHEPDVGSSQNNDLKTPQQRPRKKKHRPKVDVEDKSKPKPRSTTPACSEKTSIPKRKYVRRNKASTEGETPTEGRIQSDPGSEVKTTPKRKYTRKKGGNEPTMTPPKEGENGTSSPKTNKEGDNGTSSPKTNQEGENGTSSPKTNQEGENGTSSPKTDQAPRKSCRRSLKFDSDCQISGASSSCQNVSDLGCKSTSQISLGENQAARRVDVIVEKTETCVTHDLVQSVGVEFEEYLLTKGVKTVCSSTPPRFDKLDRKLMASSPDECSTGRCQIVFSDTTHDKQVSILESKTQEERVARIPPCTSNCSSILPQERHGRRGTKRERPSSADLSDSCGIKPAGVQRNYFQDFSEIPQSKERKEEFPHVLFKKKKSVQVHKSTVSTMLPTITPTDYRAQNNAHASCSAYVNNCRQTCCFETMQINFNTDSGPSRISAVHSAQLEQASYQCIQSLGNAGKRTKGKSKGPTHYLLSCTSLSNASFNPLTSQEVSYSHGLFHANKPKLWTSADCSPPSKMLKGIPSVDAIVEQFNRLDIEAESNDLVSLEKNDLIPYHWQNALVVYHRDQTMIPFDALSNRIKKRKPRPKVNLDEETARVWFLLLENINNEGIDGTDEEKRKYWQQERKIFRGRINSFIAKMRLVQGDRRFRPWKGSVLDSIIGVFLTQNVSDHLSSSAFMSMAARFPLKPGSDHASAWEGIGEIHDLSHLEENTFGEVSGALLAMKNRNTNDRNYQDLVRNLSEVTESIGTVRSPSSDSSECGPSTFTDVKNREFYTLNGEALISDGDLRTSDDILSSQASVISSQNSTASFGHPANKKELSPLSFLEESTSDCSQRPSFLELLQMQEQKVYNPGNRNGSPLMETIAKSGISESYMERYADHRGFVPSPNIRFSESFKENEHFATDLSGLSEESAAGPSSQNSTDICFEQQMFFMGNHDSAVYSRLSGDQQTKIGSSVQYHASFYSEGMLDPWGRTTVKDGTNSVERRAEDLVTPKPKSGKNAKEPIPEVDWDMYRKQVESKGKKDRTANTMDSVDWEAVRCTEVGEIAETIKERGMNNRLAQRIKDFLNRLIRDHGSIDLEWLRDIPPDKAKEYLLSVRGLGLKSVECVRLLTLHQLAFPVDTNVGRIAVRLGWVPLQPLPESLQLHLLELYPVLESIQKHLWPRLCKLDQRKLYELHYHMITFGKVFCTKSKPNCNSCPMRGECRHFASAYASARLALPAPPDKSIVTAPEQRAGYGSPAEKLDHLQLPRPESTEIFGATSLLTFSQHILTVSTAPKPIIEEPTTPKPIIEEPKTPESEPIIEEPQMSESETDTEAEPDLTQCPVDIEDYMDKDDDEIPTIDLNIEALNQNLQNIIQNSVGLQDTEYSKSLVVLTPEAASIPMPKLKNINRLRTEHQVYLLPDSHQLLKGVEKREENDQCPYLLAIWSPGETINTTQPPERRCSSSSEGSDQLCYDDTCYSCNSIREATSQTVRGTLLIPCRTAMRGSFPLNGTYFQVNEVFADHESSLNPIDVPRDWLWNLRRRTVYFGTSIPTIFKGLEPYEIQYCFWRGFVCVRGFDRATRGPRPLIARLHFPVSHANKMAKNKGGTAESSVAKDASDGTPAGKQAVA